MPVDWVILHWYTCGADGRSGDRSVYGHVITKFSRISSLAHFLTHSAPLRALRAWELHYECSIPMVQKVAVEPICHNLFVFVFRNTTNQTHLKCLAWKSELVNMLSISFIPLPDIWVRAFVGYWPWTLSLFSSPAGRNVGRLFEITAKKEDRVWGVSRIHGRTTMRW